MTYILRVNGADHPVVDAWIGESLLFVLRERLGLPGTKNACEQGECGSCSVVVDGDLLCACLLLAAACTDRAIATIESVGESVGESGAEPGSGAPVLSDVQRAFVDAGAVQCGFCTPGLIMAVHSLLDRQPHPDEIDVREAISGNLCRCTGYGRILDAVARTIAERERA
jgi:carbon-monoxide dehydrogenase small subunit